MAAGLATTLTSPALVGCVGECNDLVYRPQFFLYHPGREVLIASIVFGEMSISILFF